MTSKRIAFTQELLSFIGLGGRLHLAWISSAEAQKFTQVVTAFTDHIRTLGPNPLTRFQPGGRPPVPRAAGGPQTRFTRPQRTFKGARHEANSQRVAG
jgi:F420-non-reducing hydrogenase iron-sulfur subunit